MQKLSTLCALALFTASAIGQQIFLPPSGTTADPSFSVNVFNATGFVRHQAIYDTSLFASAGIFSPIQINSLEYRQPADPGTLTGVATTYPVASFWLQNAATDYAAQSTALATNRSVAFPVTPNFSGVLTRTLATGTNPNDYVITVPLTTPFIYDPSLGQDLLIEFLLDAPPSPTFAFTVQQAVVTTNNIATSKCSTCRIVGGATSIAGVTAGTINQFAPCPRLNYTIPPGVAKHDPYGTGCYTIARSFYEQFPSVSNDLSGKTLVASMNANGGYDAFTFGAASLTMPTGVGLAMGDDVVSAAIPLPFTFEYAGGSTNQIFVDSNGSILLNVTGPSNIGGSAVALLSSPAHRIAGSMQDLFPDGVTNINNVYAEADPANPTSVFLITWVNVPCYNTTPAPVPATSTFQIALIDNGTNDTWEVRYQTLTNDSDSNAGVAITGFSLGGNALNGGSVDLTNSLISTKTDLGPLTLSGTPRPVMGTPVTYQVSNIRPGGFTMMVVSFGQDLAGSPLTGFPFFLQAPGCNAHVVPVGVGSFGPLLFGSPTDGFTFTWPTGFAGVQVFVQAFELGAALPENPANILSSNGLQVLLGIL